MLIEQKITSEVFTYWVEIIDFIVSFRRKSLNFFFPFIYTEINITKEKDISRT